MLPNTTKHVTIKKLSSNVKRFKGNIGALNLNEDIKIKMCDEEESNMSDINPASSLKALFNTLIVGDGSLPSDKQIINLAGEFQNHFFTNKLKLKPKND